MAKRNTGLNRHQKAWRKPGEERVSREDIAELLRLSQSADPEERIVAATYMCPCHVRHRNEEVWKAIYRMMEDEDARVRRRAWHTLEDGGCPTDPAFEPIVRRALQSETDRQVLGFARRFAEPYRESDLVAMKQAESPPGKQTGKCDFCGRPRVPVMQDYDTEIPAGGMTRAAWICDDCTVKT
ncbi:MAG: HEAT repeat domain-containing protein [Gemmatimonadetes bacterium]|nr:HEAT repeat domain-containing protein [Gemmatimonadota bacterium]